MLFITYENTYKSIDIDKDSYTDVLVVCNIFGYFNVTEVV